MKSKLLLCVGDSLTGGAFSSSPEFSYTNQLLRLLRNREPENNWQMIHAHDTNAAYLGGIQRQWDRAKSYRPDLIVFQGGENEIPWPDTQPKLLEGAISSAADSVVCVQTGAEVFFSDQCYLLTDNTNEEWIHVRYAATVTGTGVTRGLFGTTPRAWPDQTSIVYDVADASHAVRYAGTHWSTRWNKVFESIVAATDRQTYQPIILAGGLWWEGASGIGHTQIAAKVAAAGYSKAAFCPYAKADGTDIYTTWAAGGTSGPTARADGDVLADATTIAAGAGAAEIDAGDYILVFTWGATPATTNAEIMLVASKSGNTLTLNTTGTRNKLGSATAFHFDAEAGGKGTRPGIAKMSASYMSPSTKWETLGAATFDATNWCYGDHPTDAGHTELALAFFRGYESVAD